MTGSIILVLLYSLTLPDSWGQEINPPEVVQRSDVAHLLSSTEPSLQAWGAYLAANDLQNSAIPSIIPLLKSADRFVALSAIDALVRLRADVPENDLIAFVDANPPSAAIVLASREPKIHAALLMHLLDRASSYDWIAANQLLLSFGPPGYTPRLWREWRPRAVVHVGVGPPVIADYFCYRYDGPVDPPRAGFPPTYEYLIDGVNRIGDTTLVQGAPQTTYLRQELGPRAKPCFVDYQERRGEYLRMLARVNGDNTELRLPQTVRFFWVDDSKFQADAEGLRESLRSKLIAIRRGLIERGRLTASEGAVLPDIDIRVLDERRDRIRPLPEIDWAPDR